MNTHAEEMALSGLAWNLMAKKTPIDERLTILKEAIREQNKDLNFVEVDRLAAEYASLFDAEEMLEEEE